MPWEQHKQIEQEWRDKREEELEEMKKLMFDDDLSVRGKRWADFSYKVLKHIEEYTVPQYGDYPNDLLTTATKEACLFYIDKYIKRAGRNVREGQDELDMMKVAHYAQIIHDKLGDK